MSATTASTPAPGSLLAIEGTPRERLVSLLKSSRAVMRDGAEAAIGDLDRFRGRAVGLMFFEDSTRTRVSFVRAAQHLGLGVLDLTGAGSSASKGESVADTAQTVEAMGPGVLVVRARGAGAAQVAACATGVPVINAGDGAHEHPTQALLDALTLADAWGIDDAFGFADRRVHIVGDIASSRVARSAARIFIALGAKVTLVGPPLLAPKGFADSLGADVSWDLDAELPRAEAVMMLRVQFERHAVGASGGANKMSPAIASLREYTAHYRLTPERAARMPRGAVVMHPGPMNRDVEIDPGVADDRHPLAGGEPGALERGRGRSLVLAQVARGVAVRTAVLAHALSVGDES